MKKVSIRNKKVQKIMLDHILESFDGSEYDGIEIDDNRSKLKQEIKNLKVDYNSTRLSCEKYIEGGGLLVSNFDIVNFLGDLGISTDVYLNSPFDYYKYHVAGVMTQIYRNQK